MPGESDIFKTNIEAMCRRLLGRDNEVSKLRRLTGGANMESWLIGYGGNEYVLRRMPPGLTDVTNFERIDLAAEARIIEAAGAEGVTVPKICGALVPGDDLGNGFLMEKIGGEALPHKIFRNDSYASAVSGLTGACASELAKIHALDADAFTGILEHKAPQDMMQQLKTRFEGLKAMHPVISAALFWLENHLPEPRASAMLHGDFRMGNLMVDKKGIAGVLDWELAHIGDPAQDLGYLCTPSWRFGNYNKTVGGFGELDDLLTAYADKSGVHIARRDIYFWMIYSSLWWALVCYSMADFWRSGADRSLERIIIGRRASECMIDVLLLLEDVQRISAGVLDWKLPEEPEYSGRPYAAELVGALSEWVTDGVIPTTESRDLFQARVARNGLGMLEREARLAPEFSRRRAKRLGELELDAPELCKQISSGQLVLSDDGVLMHLRHSVLEQIAIDQPRYAGMASALKKWTQ